MALIEKKAEVLAEAVNSLNWNWSIEQQLAAQDWVWDHRVVPGSETHIERAFQALLVAKFPLALKLAAEDAGL